MINSHTNNFSGGSVLGDSIFKVIPVIDLLDGVVVHAKKGERAGYQSIQSLLTHSAQPLDIVAALLNFYPFKQLYIADLNAIQKLNTLHPNNYNVIVDIQRLYPELELWVDAGINSAADLVDLNMDGVKLILGSENHKNLSNYLKVSELLQNNFILSLDYFSNGYQGPSELIESDEYWPKDIIVMSLANIGANQGANVDLLNEIKLKASQTNIYAAGGIRNLFDLQTVKTIGMQGVLIATSIHTQQITSQDLKEI